MAKASGRKSLAAVVLARTAWRIADKRGERDVKGYGVGLRVFRLVITSKGCKAGVTNEFPRYVNGTVKLHCERHILRCGAESIRH